MFPPFRASLSIRLGLLLAAIDLVLGQGSVSRFGSSLYVSSDIVVIGVREIRCSMLIWNTYYPN